MTAPGTGNNDIISVHHYRYQRAYFFHPIESFWKDRQTELLNSLQGKSFIVYGDGRCDSPGFSTKYCTYTIMDTESNLILHLGTLMRYEVNLFTYSPPLIALNDIYYCCRLITNQPTWKLKRALRFLKEKINISEFVTDASTTVISCLGIVCTCMCIKQHVQPSVLHTGLAANEFPENHHSLDVWHKSKKLKKSLSKFF